MNNNLTVLIPTYNRKENLTEVLNVLANQTNSDFSVVICDNASPYNVNDVIESLEEDFKKRIMLYIRPFNIGGSVNILECFSLCKSKWAWMLSDDDIVRPEAVENIYRWIDKYPECGCFNFTLCNMAGFACESYICMNSIEEFISNYRKYPEYHGDLIFMSNKVYNLPIVSNYMIHAFKNVNSGLFITVIFAKLLENNIPFVCVKDKVVEYNNESPRAWDPTGIMLGTRMLADVKYNIDEKSRKHLVKIQAFNITTIYDLYFLRRNEVNNDKYFFEKIYYGIYKYVLPMHSKILLRIIVATTKVNIGFLIWKFIFVKFFRIRSVLNERVINSRYKPIIKKIIFRMRK